jgi:GNAT superfamily N-acetyltransferase
MTGRRPDKVAVTLRQATARDSEFAFQVKKTALGEYVRQVWGWDEDEQRRLHRRRFAEQAFQVVVADGKDAGVLALSYEPDCVRVNQLLVLPNHQGKGVGTACMELVIEDAAGRGLAVRLQVLKVNQRAMVFYRRLGFHAVGEDEAHVRMEMPARGSPGA